MSEINLHFDKAEEFSVWSGRIVHPNNRFFSRSWFFFQFSTFFITIPLAAALLIFWKFDDFVYFALIAGGIIGDLVTIQKFKVNRKASNKDLSTDLAFPRDVTLDQAGLHFASALEETKLSWRNVGNISDDKYGIALWLGEYAVPLPNRLLPDGWSRAELHAQIEEWRKEAAR